MSRRTKQRRLKCPIHKCKLEGSKTRFGLRYECPTFRCTVVCWNGSSSTPADYETRQARIKAHNAIDGLWKGQWRMRLGHTREKLYEILQHVMGLRIKETHIGHFNIEQCNEVINFCDELKADWFARKAQI